MPNSFQEIPLNILIGAGAVVIALAAVIFIIVRARARRRSPAIEEPRRVEVAPSEKSAATPGVSEKTPGQAPTQVADRPVAKKDLRSLLTKTQEAFTAKLDALILSTKSFDASFLDSLEELLYTSDLGPKTVEKLLLSVRAKVSRGELSDLDTVKKTLFDEILSIVSRAGDRMRSQALAGVARGVETGEHPWVILVVGVNGVGKTTSIGKLARFYSDQHKKVLVVAGDTFRAAAESQLSVWGERAHVDVYTSETTKDAAAVAFQGIEKGKAEKADVIIVDTAGRLHTKENLMEELKKIKRVSAKAQEGAPNEVILVIDANSGQNARVQAQQFNDALGVTSLIVTKLDGTARGGVIVSIAEEVGLGVQFVGTGEQIGDLSPFDSEEYARGLLKI